MKLQLFLVSVTFYLLAFHPAFNQSIHSDHWSQFRGTGGSGILDNAGTPVSWNMETGDHLLWKTPVPGLAHSSPVIWEDKVFITSAVGTQKGEELRIGLYGDIDMADDQVIHQFNVYCLDRKSGKILWEKVAYNGVPKERRHTKSTYANPTPATDGKHLVAFFGSHGIYCYDLQGNLIWKKDLGKMATGPYNENGVEWGFSSSPVIHQDKVVIQADLLSNSFITLLDIRTGTEIWRTSRESISSWGSPAIYTGQGKTQIILNGFPYMMAYDFNTGQEIWRIGQVGDAPAPTAVMAKDLIYLNSAHGRWSPIVAIRPTATGDITLPDTVNSSEQVAWMVKRGGAYMASLLVYGDNLYNMQISGLLTVYDALTGEMRYKQNLGKAFSASPVASDDKIYLTAETGEVYVLEDSPEYKLLAENNMNDVCMATPAIAPGMLLFRTQHFVIAVGE